MKNIVIKMKKKVKSRFKKLRSYDVGNDRNHVYLIDRVVRDEL